MQRVGIGVYADAMHPPWQTEKYLQVLQIILSDNLGVKNVFSSLFSQISFNEFLR